MWQIYTITPTQNLQNNFIVKIHTSVHWNLCTSAKLVMLSQMIPRTAHSSQQTIPDTAQFHFF